MNVYVVMVLSLLDFGEPFGVYSSIDGAKVAKAACLAKYTPRHVDAALYDKLGMLPNAPVDDCEIWQFRVDGELVSYAPDAREAVSHDE
jgi:hypothetical protein